MGINEMVGERRPWLMHQVMTDVLQVMVDGRQVMADGRQDPI